MKRRILFSIFIAFLYTVMYVGVLVWQGKAIEQTDLVLGAVVFAVTFYTLRTWLENRRSASHAEEKQPSKTSVGATEENS